MKEPVRIILIEDDPTIRDAYKYLINELDDYKVIQTYSSAESAIRKLHSDNPGLIIMDIGLPGMNGIQAIQPIRRILPEVPILVLTVHESEDFIFSALAQGASGYLTKNCRSEKVLNAIREITSGGGTMSANVARIVFGSFRRSDSSPLTMRETEILECVASGMSRGQIADYFQITQETVKSHIKNIYRKLKVHSRVDAIRMARSGKLIL